MLRRKEKEGGKKVGKDGRGEKFAWAGAGGGELSWMPRPSASVRRPPPAARPLDQWDSIDQIARHFTILLNYRNATERPRRGAVPGGI